MLIIVRIVGWIFIVAGFAVLWLDLAVSIKVGLWSPTALAQLWFRLDPSSFHIAQALVRGSVFDLWPALALVAMGALLVILFSRPSKLRRRQLTDDANVEITGQDLREARSPGAAQETSVQSRSTRD